MKQSTRAALLSGLVLPGLGQYHNRQRAKGGVMMAVIIILVLVLSGRIFSLVYHVLMTAANASRDLILIPSRETLAEIHRRAYSENGWLLLLIVALWLYSIGDAYRTARRQERAQPPVDY